MFNSKLTTLYGSETKQTSVSTPKSSNAFLNEGMKESAKTLSGNGALKYSTTGNDFVDQFGKLSEYKLPRAFDLIAKDASTLYAINPRVSVMFILFIRMITRVVSFFDGVKTKVVQRGAGLKHEAIVRMIWLHVTHPDTFWKNIKLFITVGSWKDIIYMMQYDIIYHSWKGRVLDWDNLVKIIVAGLENPHTTNLVKKYLPQIRANNACKTVEAQADNIIAKFICAKLFNNDSASDIKHYKSYRKLKVSGTAHQWQQLISRGQFLKLNFDTIAGRALAQLVSGKFLLNNNLVTRYESWLATKPIAKFTGYPHELFLKDPRTLKKYQIDTVDKQFLGLVATAQDNAKEETSLIVVRDVSGSMSSLVPGIKMSCGDVAKALALFFSYMLPKGVFANSWIEFARDAKLQSWKGATPCEKWANESNSGYCQNTDFMSVIRLFCSLKSKGVSESEFPTGILCISD